MSTDLAIFCGYEWHRVTDVLGYSVSKWGCDRIADATVCTAVHDRLTGSLDTVVVHVSAFGDRLWLVSLDRTRCSHPNYRGRS